MPPISIEGEVVTDDAVRVLITGFGPFGKFVENPSWLAVKPLHNTVIYVDPPPPEPPKAPEYNPYFPDDPPGPTSRFGDDQSPRQVHITTYHMPVCYQSVLDEVPLFHARPPVLTEDREGVVWLEPPTEGYDFIFHVGVAGRGPLRVERKAHKYGYIMKDVTGELAPLVKEEHRTRELTEREKQEIELAGSGVKLPAEPELPPPKEEIVRGFGEHYQVFDRELKTDLDVEKIVNHLKENGFEHTYSSMDPGRFLCDFIFYCSLAESRRVVVEAKAAKPKEQRKQRDKGDQNQPQGPPPPVPPPRDLPKWRADGLEVEEEWKGPGRKTQVLFLHCPPVGQPLGTDEVTEAIRRVVVWVCATV